MSSDQLEPIDRFRSRHLQPGEAVELLLKGTPPSKLDPAPSDDLLVLTDRRVAAYSYRRREREE
ncbi:hypothetical protein, partial [Inquilinus sp.]|uniref:hypothetical protein n=1 Tax=Inquilinus sp. TaxID=1932117 RepID=UPI0031DF1DE0